MIQQQKFYAFDHSFKIIVLGNQSVGKVNYTREQFITSLVLRFCDEIFVESQYKPTVGVDFKIRTLTLQGKVVKLQIWDTAGGERFRSLTSQHYKGAHAIILSYDITDKQSFQDVQNWLQDASKFASQDVIYVLVGNKSDLEQQRQVTYEEGKEFADGLNIRFLESSSKSNINVEKTFMQLALELKAQVSKDGINDSFRINKKKDNSYYGWFRSFCY